MSAALWDLVAGCRVYDLAQPLEHGMPVSPNHPGFKLALMRRHGDMCRADGSSAANEMMLLGGHTGTHVDALCHVSLGGKLHGGADAAEAQTGGRFRSHGVEEIPLTFCHGVMLDVPALHGTDVLEPGAAITARDLAGAPSPRARSRRVPSGPGGWSGSGEQGRISWDDPTSSRWSTVTSRPGR